MNYARRKYRAYRKALGYTNTSNLQFDVYFDILSSTKMRLSAPNMALIAQLLQEQESYGEAKMYKELKN